MTCAILLGWRSLIYGCIKNLLDMILAFDCLLDRRFLTYNCVNTFLLCFYYLLWRRSFYVPLYDCPSITVLAWPNQPLRVDGVHPSHDDLARSFAVMLMGHFLRSPPPRRAVPVGLSGSPGCACKLRTGLGSEEKGLGEGLLVFFLFICLILFSFVCVFVSLLLCLLFRILFFVVVTLAVYICAVIKRTL